jgi:hypothetical protein
VPASDAGGLPLDIAIDSASVFWASDDGTVRRVNKSDGRDPLTSPVFAGAGGPGARIAVDLTSVYYANPMTATVYALTKDLSSSRTIYVEKNGWTPVGLASNDVGLYWAHVNGSTFGGIMRAVLPNGNVTEVWPDRHFPQEVAVDQHYVYWAENQSAIEQGALDGTGSAICLSGSSPCNALQVDNAGVFWTSSMGNMGFVASTPIGTATADCSGMAAGALILANDSAQPFGLALGAGHAFWTDGSTVQSVPENGTCAKQPCAEVLAKTQNAPGRIAADGQAAYWVNTGDMSIGKVAF